MQNIPLAWFVVRRDPALPVNITPQSRLCDFLPIVCPIAHTSGLLRSNPFSPPGRSKTHSPWPLSRKLSPSHWMISRKVRNDHRVVAGEGHRSTHSVHFLRDL